LSEFSGELNKLQQISKALERATFHVTGEVGRNPLEVFPDPKTAQRRADVVWNPNLSEEQEQRFRADMGEIGPGITTDIGPAEVGFENHRYPNWGYIAILEGGQPHKMIAQLRIIRDPGRDLLPIAIWQTASADRKIGDDEIKFMAKYLGCDISEVGETELDVAEQILRHEADFEVMIPGLNKMPTDEVYQSAKGSLMDPYFIGKFLNPSPEDPNDTAQVYVQLMGVKAGSDRYTQASNADKMRQVIEFLDSDDPLPRVGFVTSATYQPSNVISAHLVAQETGVNVQVLSYGTERLAQVRGIEPEQPALHQLGGEAYKTAELLAELPDSGE
jgi:hypothetical protein